MINFKKMKYMKHIRRFNEELSVDDTFDSEEISSSLADWWISCEDHLPKPNQDVIVYVPKSQMQDYSICTFLKGISLEERKEMNGNERARTIKDADESGNNKKPYCWKRRGPGTYFGQEVTHWMPLPSKPGTF